MNTRTAKNLAIAVAAYAALSGCTASIVIDKDSPPKASTVRMLEWPLHNFDLAGTRFTPSDQITPDNVASLKPAWLFQHGVIDGVSNQTTPIIVDGIMYVTDARGSVYATNATDGHLLWEYNVSGKLGGGRREGYIFRHRGVVVDDGIVYTAAGSFIFALDAKNRRAH